MNLPEGWAHAPLLDLVELHDSRRIPLNQSERAAMPGDFPYYGANGQVGTVGKFLFEGHYILLAEDGGFFDQPGRPVAYEAQGQFWVNNHAHILSTRAGMPVSFFTRLLNTLDWMKFVSGTTRLKLTQGGMQQIRLPLPPIAEQRRIVAKLNTLTDRLTRARAELDRVAAMATALRWQSVVGAFNGTLTARWRELNGDNAATDKELDRAYIRIVGTSRRKPPAPIDWKPPITLPATWRWVSVDQVVAKVQYGTSAKTNSEAQGVPVLRMGNIQDGKLDWQSLKYLPRDHPEFPALELHDGDVLFNRTNSFELVGKTAVYRNAPTPASFASYLIRLQTSAVVPELLSYYLNSSFSRHWVQSTASQQVGQANVNGSKLKALGFPLPPDSEQREIVSALDMAFARADRIEAEAARARALLDRLEASILARAFRGELVPQDPDDEPASVLLNRIRCERAAAPKARRGRRAAVSA